MIIEFYGLPGSGKTTVANQLCNTLKENRVPYITADNYLKEYCRKGSTLKSLLHPYCFKFIISVLGIAAKYKLIRKKDVIIRIIRIAPVIDYYRTHQDELIIMDQAVIQQFVSAFYNYCELSKTDMYMIPSIIDKYSIKPVHVTAATSVASNRISIRGEETHGRLDSIIDNGERRNVLIVQEKNFSECRSLLENSNKSIDFDNTKSGVINVTPLLKALDLVEEKGLETVWDA